MFLPSSLYLSLFPFQGAIPATIAIVDGRIKVGTTADQLARLAQSDTIKTSRRDLAYVLSKGLSGGTTVAGTLLVADMVGIRVFATGGIGGVHRGGQDTLDVSADLVELGRTPVAVVSSGVKSILDIPRTLEYLVRGYEIGLTKILIAVSSFFRKRKEFASLRTVVPSGTFRRSTRGAVDRRLSTILTVLPRRLTRLVSTGCSDCGQDF